MRRLDVSVGIAAGWTAGVEFPDRGKRFLFRNVQITSIQWVSAQAVKLTTPSNSGAIPPLPHTISWRGAQ
jgi:hypothetical protein